MAGISLEKKKQIYKAGQPMTALHLITTGKVRAEHQCGSYELGKGDVIGICELCSEVHFLSYHTLEDTVILTYPVNNMEALDQLLTKHPDVARLFLLSMFHQIGVIMDQFSLSEANCTALYRDLEEDYSHYRSLCSRYNIPAKTIPGIEEIQAYLNEEFPDVWLSGFYMGLKNIYAGDASKLLTHEPGVSLGLLRKGSLDFRKTYSVLDEHAGYIAKIAGYYFHPSGKDLFDAMTSLYYRLGPANEDADSLYADINRIILQFEDNPALDSAAIAGRVKAFQEKISVLTAPEFASNKEDSSQDAAILSELAGSIDTIIQFSGLEEQSGQWLKSHIQAFLELPDKNGMDDKATQLRKQLITDFYPLYKGCFLHSLEVSHLPVPVKMFLYFGYIDENLAGLQNCTTLYNLACGVEDQSRFGVYTFYHWLLAIYHGEKAPSRNEFDEDYSSYIHKLKLNGLLSAAELSAMENDPVKRINYELENMFPQVNKTTYGRITAYCPFFFAENSIKDLGSTYVTVSRLVKALELIQQADYSAFYRESLDHEHLDTVGRETIHLKYLPDIILMPNAGIRGVMWQEIEGKVRNSPGRMCLSIFHMEDINTTMIRLTGEFRWELCKRIQGSRWNDVTERSLTSEYFDYIQFFKKNHDLNTDAKEKLRTGLQRAKNSFKEMFVRDYMIWILYESKGSPRLNKVARKILFTYCPFPAGISNTIAQNPLYAELCSRRKIQIGQRLHHLDLLTQRIRSGGNSIPATLETERAFTEGKL